jgi:hypothetical protein
VDCQTTIRASVPSADALLTFNYAVPQPIGSPSPGNSPDVAVVGRAGWLRLAVTPGWHAGLPHAG